MPNRRLLDVQPRPVVPGLRWLLVKATDALTPEAKNERRLRDLRAWHDGYQAGRAAAERELLGRASVEVIAEAERVTRLACGED
jgi:hypothetical protein